MHNNAENAGVDESTSVTQKAEQHADHPESVQQTQTSTTATTTGSRPRDCTAKIGKVPTIAPAAPSDRKGKQQAQRPHLPNLSFNPEYPNNWNGSSPLVRPFNDAGERDAVRRIFHRLGALNLLQRHDSGDFSAYIASNTDVAKGLIRRLLHAQIFFMGDDFEHNNRKACGYATGAELFDPIKSTFNEEFFSVLFSGIMAETQVQVPHYVYSIQFCKKLMTSMASGHRTAATQVDPDFTVSLFLLNEVIKNIHEESIRQFDTLSSSAYGWLNIWLLGVQKILICKKVPSEQHLKMFRNAVAHNQFDMHLNYIQLFNRAPSRNEASDNSGPITWMGRIVLSELAEVSMVLTMLHNSGYILNISQDQQNMNRRSAAHPQAMEELRLNYPQLPQETLEDVLLQTGGDPTAAINALANTHFGVI